jgi:hypothetical protein
LWMFIPPNETGILQVLAHPPLLTIVTLCGWCMAWMLLAFARTNGTNARIHKWSRSQGPMPFILPVFTHRHTHICMRIFMDIRKTHTHTKHHSTIYIYTYTHRSTDFTSPIMLLRTTIYLW